MASTPWIFATLLLLFVKAFSDQTSVHCLNENKLSISWRHTLPSAITTTPRVFLDPVTGEKRILMTMLHGYVSVLDSQGQPLPGYPVLVSDTIHASSVYADFDNDSNLDIATIDSDGNIYVYPLSSSTYQKSLSLVSPRTNSIFHVQIPKLMVQKNWFVGLDPVPLALSFPQHKSSQLDNNKIDYGVKSKNDLDDENFNDDSDDAYKKKDGPKSSVYYGNVNTNEGMLDITNIYKDNIGYSSKNTGDSIVEQQGSEQSREHLFQKPRLLMKKIGKQIKLKLKRKKEVDELQDVRAKEDQNGDKVKRKGYGRRKPLSPASSTSFVDPSSVNDNPSHGRKPLSYDDYLDDFDDNVEHEYGDGMVLDLDLDYGDILAVDSRITGLDGERKIRDKKKYRRKDDFTEDDFEKHVLIDAHVLSSPIILDVDGDEYMDLVFAVSYFFDKSSNIKTDQYNDKIDVNNYISSGIIAYSVRKRTILWSHQLDMTTIYTNHPAILLSSPLAISLTKRKHQGSYGFPNNDMSDVQIILPSSLGFIYGFDAKSGAMLPNYPLLTGPVLNDITAEDVDGDGDLEMLILDTAGTLWCMTPNGQEKWVYHSKDSTHSNGVVVGDINGDGVVDIVFTTDSNKLWAVDGKTGSLLPNYPLLLSGRVVATPTLVNLDIPLSELLSLTTSTIEQIALLNRWKGNHGKGLHIVVGDVEGNLYVVNPFTHCIQSMHLGEGIKTSILVEDFNNNNILSLLITTVKGSLFNINTHVPYHRAKVVHNEVKSVGLTGIFVGSHDINQNTVDLSKVTNKAGILVENESAKQNPREISSFSSQSTLTPVVDGVSVTSMRVSGSEWRLIITIADIRESSQVWWKLVEKKPEIEGLDAYFDPDLRLNFYPPKYTVVVTTPHHIESFKSNINQAANNNVNIQNHPYISKGVYTLDSSLSTIMTKSSHGNILYVQDYSKPGVYVITLNSPTKPLESVVNIYMVNEFSQIYHDYIVVQFNIYYYRIVKVIVILPLILMLTVFAYIRMKPSIKVNDQKNK